MYLGTDSNIYSFRKPADISRARWISKIIYFLKFVLLSTQLQHLNMIMDLVLQQLVFFTNSCVVYVPWWITSSAASEVPIYDYCLLMLMLMSYVHLLHLKLCH